MHLLSSQDALLILRVAFGSCRLLYVMRTSNCVDHPALNEFDLLLRKGLSRITNCDISESAWLQASLPISAGGLGIRSVSMLAPSTRDLQDAILGYDPLLTTDGAVLSCEDAWSDLADSNPPPSEQATKQRSWDKIVVEECRARLEVSAKDQVDRARLIAVSAPHAGDWLKAMPISAFGLRLDDDSIRIAVGLRLGLPLCSSHSCPCGEQVDSRGIHGLSCRTSAGRSARHSMLNDIICRALASAGIPSVKEPVGLGSYVDEGGVEKGLRPDGLTLIPWSSGRCLAWDATVSDTLAPSYLPLSIHSAGAVAEAAADRKRRKYLQISESHHFIPIAVETLGPICEEGASFISAIADKISRATGDQREKTFLFQRISVAIQRGLSRNHDFILSEYASHLRSRPVIFYLYF